MVVVFILFFLPAATVAQRAIGIDWQVPQESSQARAELRSFSALGISHIQINQALDDSIWKIIEDSGLTVFGKLPINFPVAQSFSTIDSASVKSVNNLLMHYQKHEAVQAIGIFSHGAVLDKTFREAFSAFIEPLKKTITKPLYYQTAYFRSAEIDTVVDFKVWAGTRPDSVNNEKIGAYLYNPSPLNNGDASTIKEFLEYTAHAPQKPVFFSGSWLQHIIKKQPGIAQTIQLFATTAEPVFPLPQEQNAENTGHNLIVILLLAVWLIFGFAYSYNPVYRKSFIRYFTGHTFYVEDVMQRHIRTRASGIAVLVQHCIASSLSIYCIVQLIFSSLGQKALHSHYPALFGFGMGPLTIFFWAIIITAIIELIHLFWIRLANPKVAYLSQVINLYCWPLQLNLIIATLISALFLSGGQPVVIYLLGLVFLGIFIASFIITSLDTGKYIISKRLLYYTSTISIYMLLIIGGIIWVLVSSELTSVIKLAATLP